LINTATATATEIAAATNNNNNDDVHTSITTPTIRSIFAASTARQQQSEATTVHTDTDGIHYSIGV
jgi:hypothetical protein